MPLYGLWLVTLTGEKANLPEVCQGIRQVLTPCSTAFTMESVTFWYTSCFSPAVFSCVDIEVAPNFWCLGAVPSVNLSRSRFRSGMRFASIIEPQTCLQNTAYPLSCQVKSATIRRDN